MTFAANISLSLLVALVACSAGCVTTSTGDKMQQDIEAIRAEQQEMKENYDAQKARLTDMIRSARQDVSELKSVLKQARALLQRNNADLGVEIQKNRQAIDQLHGRLETMDFKSKRINQDLAAFKEDVDLRFSGGENLPDDAVALFEYAKKAFDAHQYKKARRGFGRFVQQFPDHGKAADAQYLLGMTQFSRQKWVSSVFSFKKVVERYDTSARVDDATYHIGAALAKVGRCKQAKGWFELLENDYGNSRWVGQARQQLAQMKSGGCQSSPR